MNKGDKIFIGAACVAIIFAVVVGLVWGTWAEHEEQPFDDVMMQRRLTVMNGSTQDILFQITGNMSLYIKDNYITIEVEDEKSNNTTNVIKLNDNTVYTIEELRDDGSYEIVFNEQVWQSAQKQN